MLARAATASAAFMLGVLLAGTMPSWAGSHTAPGGGLPGGLQGQTDLPWGTTLKQAPTGNTSQSAFSPTNLQIPNGVCKEFFEALLALFAREAGAGRERTIVLQLDNAGWHGEAGLAIPEGIRLVYLPAYSPELQPAETLWALVDEPIINQHIPTIGELEQIIARRCVDLAGMPDRIRSQTRFHWWPERDVPK